jgi:hypothetical protein
MKNITLRLKGGLGNQLFQVRQALDLCNKIQAELALDVSWYDLASNKFNSHGKRIYSLKNFEEFTAIPIVGSRAQFFDVYMDRIVNRTPKRIRNKFGVYVEDEVSDLVESSQEKFKIQGYWISGAPLDVEINRLTLVKEHINSEFNRALRLILNPSLVSVHVRLGDFQEFPEIYNVCDTFFYLKQIKVMCQTLELQPSQVTVCLFSDGDITELHNVLIEHQYNVLEFSKAFQLSDLQTFMILSRAQNIICSNSTFSWWAARLNSESPKRVIFPKYMDKKRTSESLQLNQDNWRIAE